MNATVALPGGMALPGGPSDYLVPTTGSSDEGSATGRLAGLRAAPLVDDGAARHSTAVAPRGAPTELSAPQVTQWITAVAGGMVAGAGSRTGVPMGLRRGPRLRPGRLAAGARVEPAATRRIA